MLALGGAIGGIGALLSPLLVPVVFGSQYDEAIRVVQIMCLVLPFIYASNPLLARLYTSGMERQVIAASLFASLVGTVAIVAGQLTIGATGAAGGYVLRQILFTLVLAALSVRNHRMRRGWCRGHPYDQERAEATCSIHRDPWWPSQTPRIVDASLP